MPAQVVSVAEEVKEMLNEASLSQAVTAVRNYADWDLELTDEGTLHVDVVLVTTKQQAELYSRGEAKYTVPVDIAIRQKFAASDQDAATGRVTTTKIDELMLLVEEIHEVLLPHRLTDFASGVWKETKILVAPIHKHLREMFQFTGIVRVTFETAKAL